MTLQRTEPHVAAHIGHAIELTHHAETLPVEAYSSRIGILRRSRILIRCRVVGINHAIAVEVDDLIHARQFLIVIGVVDGGSNELVPGVGPSVGLPRTVLSDGIVHRFLVGRQQGRIVVFLDDVLCVGHVEVTPQTPVASQLLIDAQFQFVAMRLYTTQIGCRCGSTVVGRHGTAATGYEDIFSVLPEEVEATGQYAV